MERNRGGWPAKRKTIFDAATRRKTNIAIDKLASAEEHICRTATFIDAPLNLWANREEEDAVAILRAASVSVRRADDSAQSVAKAGQR